MVKTPAIYRLSPIYHFLAFLVCVFVCFFVLCNRHRFNRVPGAPPRDGLGVTYLPFTISSDAGYADLPLALLGAPVSIGALLEPGSRSPGAEPPCEFPSRAMSGSIWV